MSIISALLLVGLLSSCRLPDDLTLSTGVTTEYYGEPNIIDRQFVSINLTWHLLPIKVEVVSKPKDSEDKHAVDR